MLEFMISALEAVEVNNQPKEQGTQLHDDILKAINQQFGGAREISELKEKYALKTVEVAKLYGISKTVLEQWRSQGRGPRFYREGRLILYRVKDIEDYLDGGIVRTIDQP
jgi:DNA-binding transcriptional regulator YiaG